MVLAWAEVARPARLRYREYAPKCCDAKRSLQAAIEPLKAAKDHRKHVSALEQLAGLEEQEGHGSEAKALLTEALALATAADLKDERKSIRKRLDALA